MVYHLDLHQGIRFHLRVCIIIKDIAVGLEVPNIADLIDIPIKIMYVNVDFDNSFDDMIKVNNKL